MTRSPRLSRCLSRHLRLFLEPLEDRRLLTTMYAVDDAVSTSMNGWVEFGVLGNDYTDPQASFWLDEYGQPANGSLSETNGSFTYTPNLGFSGTDSFWYVAETEWDAVYYHGMATVTIEVASADDFYSTSSGTQLTVSAPGVLANDYDPDGYPAPASLVSGTTYGSLNLNTDGGFTYIPSGPFVTDSFTYSSGAGASTVTITSDDTPTAHGDSYTINVGATLNVPASGVLANDTGVGTLSAALVDPPASGLLDLQGDGSFTYEPQAGFRGEISFSYTASDGTLTSSSAVVTIRVNAVPQAANDSLGTTEDTPLTLYAPGILGNDTDADGDSLAAIYASGPAHGVLTLHTDGSFTYTPDLNYNGSDNFSYRASDGLDESDVAVVSISMSAANDAPVASNETYSTPQDTLLDVSYPGVLANDDDAEDNYLTAVLATGPAHGALTLSPLGGFYYTPAAGYYGTDSFTYRAQDAALQSAPATVTLTVQQAFAPIAQPNSYYTDIDTPLTTGAPQLSSVLANDYDPNGNALTAVLTAGPAHGTFTLNPNGHFTYTPAAGFHGLDSFTYRAQDTGGLLSPPTLVSLTVGPDLEMGKFKSDGDQWQFNYFVRGALAGSYEIGVYASPDGVTLGQLLQSTPGRTEAGPHNHYLPPQFNDLSTDYYLVVKLDRQDSLTEASEDNNWRRFDGGSFLVTQPASGDTELHAHGLDSNDAFFASQDNGIVTLSSSLQFQDEEYTAANFTAIRLRPHGGHDTAAIDAALTKPAWLFGGAGHDSLSGGAADDHLFGGTGMDWLSGNEGNDRLNGEGGADILEGNDGDDMLIGMEGADAFTGGNGMDTLDYSASPTAVTVSLETYGPHTGGHAQGDLLAINLSDPITIENIIGSAFDDTLIGNALDNFLDGGEGNDVISGGDGSDWVFGGDGNDTLNGGNEYDTISGGDGNDTLNGGNGDDELDSGEGADTTFGGDGSDTIEGTVDTPTIGLFMQHEVREGQSLVASVWLSGKTDHAVTATISIQTNEGPAAAGRWAQLQIPVLIPAGDSHVQITLATINDDLVNGDNFYTVALTNPSGADLQSGASKTVNLLNNDDGISLSWSGHANSAEPETTILTGFDGTLRATVGQNEAYDASGTDFYGHAFSAHVVWSDSTKTIAMDIPDLPTGLNHWTGNTEPDPGNPGGLSMRPEFLLGLGHWGLLLQTAFAAVTKPELKFEIGGTRDFNKPQADGLPARQQVATNEQVNAIEKIRMENGWDATNSVISPLHTVGGNVYGLSGFVIGVTGAAAGNSGTVTVTLVPYKILFKDRGQESVNLGGAPPSIVPGPANTATHENWHIDGVAAGLLQNNNIANTQFLIGFKKGFTSSADKIKQKDAIKNAASIDELKQLVMMELQSEKAAIANAGAWHKPPSVPNATQDLNA